MKYIEEKNGLIIVINIALVVIVIIVCLCFFNKYKNSKNIVLPVSEEKEEYAYTIKTEEVKNCQEEASVYYEAEGYKIYTYCLNSIKIVTEDKETELKDYLKDNPNTISEIIKELTTKSNLNDGGTVIYNSEDDSDYINNGLAIIKCHKVNSESKENNDIYIDILHLLSL